MKCLMYLGAAVALLRCAAAFLPTDHDKHDRLDDQNQLIFQPENGINKAAGTPAASTEYIEAGRFQGAASDPSQLHDTSSQSPDREPSSHDTTLPSPPSQKSNFTIGSSSSQWAMTYTPYTSTLSCLSASSIRSDVATIARKGFTSVRLYSIDCSALRHVGHAARAHGLKMIVGIHLDGGPADAESQLSEMIDWARGDASNWDLIELVVIGNEAIFNDRTTAAALAPLITASRATLRASGYRGPLTTTEPLSVLAAHRRTLCPTLDLTAATIHPFFHPSVTAATAGPYVAAQLARLAALCPGLDAVALETGWPSRGRANGDAVPGFLEQWVAVAGIAASAGGRSAFLGFGDEGWRDEGEFGVEGSWGCGHVFGGE